MKFRANREKRLQWNRFLSEYQERLESVGISEVAFRSESDWYHFIDHGYDWKYLELLNLEKWTNDGLAKLLPVLESIHEGGGYVGENSGVLNWVRARLNN